MADALADAFRSEIPCEASVASLLASLAREHRARAGGGSEDSDADLVLRFRDPRAFGSFAEEALEDPRLSPAAREALLEHVFDLLPLPRSEGDVIDVGARAPPQLLSLAARLADSEGLTVLHVMHLVYAVFLDRSLPRNVPRSTRSSLYRAVMAQRDSGENLRVLFAGLYLASLEDSEAAAELRRTLRDRDCPPSLRRSLAAIASAEDGGRASLAALAQREGLLPAELDDAQAPAVLANIPRLPEKLAAVGRRYLERTPSG